MDEVKYEYISSIHFQGEKIRVMKKHLNRILKLRQFKKIRFEGASAHIGVTRMRSSGPIHGSRSRFAKNRPRDQNGRFYTKEEYEEILKYQYKDAVIQYAKTHIIPGVHSW